MSQTTNDTKATNAPRVVSRAEWIEARKTLLAREKDFTRERDALSAARRELPMVKVEKRYVLEDPMGSHELVDLFAGKRQLVLYHFMFNPSWEVGCKSCSYVADNFVGASIHLAARDTAFAVVSRAPLAKIDAYKKRMGWTFRWLSSSGSDFNYDFHVSFRPEDVEAKRAEYNYAPRPFPMSEAPGVSVFLREGGDVFHSYSTYGRGLDLLIGTYNYLDLTPLGRQEAELPQGMSWVRRHDEYEAT